VAEIKYYLDENLHVVIATELNRNGIDTVTARDLGKLGDTDPNHLARAREMGCVLCTQDDDFLCLAASGIEHAGIAYRRPSKFSIGVWVNGLIDLHEKRTAEEMVNEVKYI